VGAVAAHAVLPLLDLMGFEAGVGLRIVTLIAEARAAPDEKEFVL
jgi:hypothetical protein